MPRIGGADSSIAVAVARVAAPREGSTKLSVLAVDSRNVGVLAHAGLEQGSGAVRTHRQLRQGHVEVWYQGRERGVRSQR